jgi:transposase
MEVICPRCAGLDVHKQTVVACARIAGDGPALQEVRTFATTTSGLLALADWLDSHGVEVVAMEATGVYWKPVWHVLEGHFELVLANAAHVKNVPGRKTDVNDAMWLADLLAHGLIRASFVPPVAVQELRTLTRTRKQFVRERTAHAQRIDKVLEDANLKLGVVLSDILGKSGRAVLQAIIDGHTDPERLASCISTRVKASHCELLEALRGHVSVHQRFMLKLHLTHIDALDQAIAAIEKEVGLGLDTFRQAGKRRSTRLRRGGKWLKTTMVQAAWAAVKVKGSYLQAQFHRLRARRGAKKAIIAVAASMLTAAWHMLRNGTEWRELGAAHFDRADAHKTAVRLVRRLQQIGYAVQLTPP